MTRDEALLLYNQFEQDWNNFEDQRQRAENDIRQYTLENEMTKVKACYAKKEYCMAEQDHILFKRDETFTKYKQQVDILRTQYRDAQENRNRVSAIHENRRNETENAYILDRGLELESISQKSAELDADFRNNPQLFA